jgi:transcriptional regulator with XRE-family HTH domain
MGKQRAKRRPHRRTKRGRRQVAGSPVAEQVMAVARLLKRTIAGAGLTQRDVERRLGWGEGYVSQILRGRVGFKFQHCFAILAALGIEPREFFAQLAAPPDGGGEGQAPAEGEAKAEGQAQGGESDKARQAAELRQEVKRWVEEILARQGQGRS